MPTAGERLQQTDGRTCLQRVSHVNIKTKKLGGDQTNVRDERFNFPPELYKLKAGGSVCISEAGGFISEEYCPH